jgi:hypothetical protein
LKERATVKRPSSSIVASKGPDVRLDRLTRAVRPPHAVELLLKVIIAPEEVARPAWREWSAARTIAAASTAEWRLLGAAGRRMLALGAEPAEQAALASIKRDIWRQNQLRISRHSIILRRLAELGLPTMVLKGGARISGEPGAAETRFVRDIDLLFPPDRLVEALAALIGMGLRSVNGRLPGMVKSQAFAPIHPAGPRPPDYLEIDVHSVPLRLGQRADNESGLWQRARPAELGGVSVLIPSASDRYVQAIAHGLVADDDAPFDWVVDAWMALRQDEFDPAIVASEIDSRRLGVPLAAGSALLRDVLGADVPGTILDACRRDVANPLYRLEMTGILKRGRERTLGDRLAAGVAEWFRSAERDRSARSWKTAWILRPTFQRPASGWTEFSKGTASLALPPEARRQRGKIRLFLRWAGEKEADRSFDLLIDGIWIGRLRLRAARLLTFAPRRAWRADVAYRFPEGRSEADQATLRIIALDDRKMPAEVALPGLRIAGELRTDDGDAGTYAAADVALGS